METGRCHLVPLQTFVILSPTSHLITRTSVISLAKLPLDSSKLSCTVLQYNSSGQPLLVKTVDTNIKNLNSLLSSQSSRRDLTLLLLSLSVSCIGKWEVVMFVTGESWTTHIV